MTNYPVAQQSVGVPAQRGLIFEPTENLTNRVIDAEGETRQLRRQVTWRTLMAVILFFMLLTAGAAVAFIWWTTEQRIQEADAALIQKDEQLVALTEQRNTLRDFANTLEEYQVAQRAADELDLEQQDFLQLTKWYLENEVTLPEGIKERWYPGGDDDRVLKEVKALIETQTALPPLDTLRIAMGSDGWRERGIESLIDDRTDLANANTELRNRTARLAAAADRPPPLRPARKDTPY